MKTKVIFQIAKIEIEGEGNVSGGFKIDCNTNSGEELAKALFIWSCQNPAFGEILKFVVNGLKKHETPLNAPPQYQA
jgi:hypothetical protein